VEINFEDQNMAEWLRVFFDRVTFPNISPGSSQRIQRCSSGISYEISNTFTLYDPPVDYSVAVELPRYCKIVAKEKFDM
jgi:hypothetical protein